MKCNKCNKDCVDLLKHLRKNKPCQSEYDMVSLIEERKLRRLEKKRQLNKALYDKNRQEISVKKNKNTMKIRKRN